MSNATAYSYVMTNALPGGIAIAMAGNGRVITNSGLQNQHVWRFKTLDANQGIFSISNGQTATTASNGLLSGAGSGSSGTRWKITPLDVHGYRAHTIQQVGGNQGYWVLNPNRLAPGTQVAVVPKPPRAPNLNPAALWVFTSINQ